MDCPREAGARRRCYAAALTVIATVARVATIVPAVVYPPVVYVGLTRFSTGGVSRVLLRIDAWLCEARPRPKPRTR